MPPEPVNALTRKRKLMLRMVLCAAVAAGFGWFLFVFKVEWVDTEGRTVASSVPDLLLLPGGPQVLIEWMRACVEGAGVWGVMVFEAIYVASVVLPMPGPIMTFVGGLLYGFWPGLALTVLGANLGVMVPFWIARVVGREAVEKRLPAGLRVWDERISRNGLFTVLMIRLFPLFPFNVANYFLGVTSVRVRDYVLGNLIGMLPFITMIAWMGATSAEFDVRNPWAWLPFACFAAFLAVLRLLGRRLTGVLDREAGSSTTTEL